jgi:soluble lytic murein transglycosylase-like protein
LFAPETNLAVGTRVLAEFLERRDGRLDAALVAYSGNAKAYPQKVRARWREFERVRRSVWVET